MILFFSECGVKSDQSFFIGDLKCKGIRGEQNECDLQA